MDINEINILFLGLSYFAVRMTTIKKVAFSPTVMQLLRLSAVLLVFSVFIDDEWSFVSNDVPILGTIGFVVYAAALSIGGKKPRLSDVNDQGEKSNPAYTVDMVVVGIITSVWIIYLFAHSHQPPA